MSKGNRNGVKVWAEPGGLNDSSERAGRYRYIYLTAGRAHPLFTPGPL